MASHWLLASAQRRVMMASAPLTVLHCVTEYPAPPDQVNLRAMAAMRESLRLPVGYSDHTLGTEISVAAAALGLLALGLRPGMRNPG